MSELHESSIEDSVLKKGNYMLDSLCLAEDLLPAPLNSMKSHCMPYIPRSINNLTLQNVSKCCLVLVSTFEEN